jgi:enterochelin esterase-like enzyme
MLKPVLLSVALLAAGPSFAAEALKVDSGHVERLEQFPSRFIDARNVDVWLPAGYDGKDNTRRYKVLYMHDGQMLYDAATTWNKQEWQVDEVLGKLIREGKVPDTIVVGVWNSEKYRHPEYFPQKALDYMPAEARKNITERALGGKPRADDYLRFLVQELKPAIDRKYATRPGRDDTAIMGSSMGGLISLYAISEYPDVFGAAGCVSTHWPGAGGQNAVMPLGFFNYMQAKLPDPKTHRIYMDHGDQTIDALYGVHQAFADILVREHGYDDRHFLSKAYPGTDHSEKSWAARLATPLEFLLGR